MQLSWKHVAAAIVVIALVVGAAILIRNANQRADRAIEERIAIRDALDRSRRELEIARALVKSAEAKREAREAADPDLANNARQIDDAKKSIDPNSPARDLCHRFVQLGYGRVR